MTTAKISIRIKTRFNGVILHDRQLFDCTHCHLANIVKVAKRMDIPVKDDSSLQSASSGWQKDGVQEIQYSLVVESREDFLAIG